MASYNLLSGFTLVKAYAAGKESNTHHLAKTGSEIVLESEKFSHLPKLASISWREICFVRLIVCMLKKTFISVSK